MADGTAARAIKEGSPIEGKELIAWQTRLLPFTITVLVALTLFACAANAYQAYLVQKHMTDTEAGLGDVLAMDFVAPQNGERLAIARWKTAATLESNALHSRYHQANLILVTRIYIVFLGFTTGLVMAMVGAAFILSKLRETPSAANATGAGWSASFSSSSPGLVLAFFGTLLMIVTIVAKVEVHVTDQPLYFSENSSAFDVLAPASGTPVDSTDQIANRMLNKLTTGPKK